MVEPHTLKFKIHKATAQIKDDGGLLVVLHYPSTAYRLRTQTTERRYSNEGTVEFGITALETLLRKGYAQIASPKYPTRPASGAGLEVLPDMDFFSHRRDGPTRANPKGGTKVHPWYHGRPSGFPATEEHFYDIYACQSYELGEESVLTTQDKEPWYYVPANDEISRTATLRRLKQLGLDTSRVVELPVEYIRGKDVLRIVDGNNVRQFNGDIYLSWEHEVNVAIGCHRIWPSIDSGNVLAFDPQTIAAFDAEGMEKDDTYIHFNREMYRFSLPEVETLGFGDPISNPRVYRLDRRRGGPVLQTDEPEVPHLFRPDDGLRSALKELGSRRWSRKLEYELSVEFIQLANLRAGTPADARGTRHAVHLVRRESA